MARLKEHLFDQEMQLYISVQTNVEFHEVADEFDIIYNLMIIFKGFFDIFSYSAAHIRITKTTFM